MKNKEKIFEIVRYLIVGVLTTLVSLVVYYGLTYTILHPDNGFELQIANVISWILSVIFAYFANRIFVFKSKNENRWKEATSFVGSRVITLIMDMTFMFVLVTLFKINDKLVKLFSQVIVIVVNYIFSKLFVFNKEKKIKKKFNYLESVFFKILFYLFPFLLFVRLFFPNVFSKPVLFVFYFFLIIYFTIFLISQKKHRISLGIIFSYVIIQMLYIYLKGFSLFENGFFLVQVFFFPMCLLFFTSNEKISFSYSSFAKLFWIYFMLFIIPFSLHLGVTNENYYLIKMEVITSMCICLPIVLYRIFHHSNYFAKSIFSLLLLLSIFMFQSPSLGIVSFLTIFLLCIINRSSFFEKKWNFLLIGLVGILSLLVVFVPINSFSIEQFLFDDRISLLQENWNAYQSLNIEEQIFGVDFFSFTKIDFIDIFFSLGIVGFLLFVLLFGYFLLHVKNIVFWYVFLFVVFLSIFSGNVFISVSVSFLLASISSSKKDLDNKRILLVTNMYPSKKYKHYGSFVLNTTVSLEQLQYHVDVVYKKKQDSLIGKIFGYTFLYLKAFFQSIFLSYDYFYVHFVSLSTYPLLFARWTSPHTKLVCNVHGNDIVPDSNLDLKNVKRSKYCLSFADIVVSPSTYFQDILEKEYNISSEKIILYPSSGIDTQVFYPRDSLLCKKELGLDEKYIYYGFVSRIEQDKGWDNLLNAVHKLHKEKSLEGIKILVIGTGSMQDEFDILVRNYHLENKIIQKSFVNQEELSKYYNAMDLFLFPTKRKSESLGLVGLEAMASKTFVIGCTLYGPREYLVNKENSFTYLNDFDGSVLASKIKEYQNLKMSQKQKIINRAYQDSLRYDKNNLKSILKDIFL